MNLVVVGAQWGDEGKGKIVDVLSRDAEIICRYSGGANAGHTIVHGGSTYKLHLVPSGVVYDHTTVVLGTGMVIDPEALFHEIAELESVGIEVSDRILVSDRAHVVLPSHKAEDKARDDQRPRPLGTTGRGIGIAYAHKAYRTGVRVADIGWSDHTSSLSKIDREMLRRYGARLTAMAVDLPEYMESVGRKRVLLEGAQGALLDIDLGTYPYVSSGSSGAGGAAGGAGIGPRAIDGVLGVCKAYTTRVGNGPLPSELDTDADGPLEHHIREIGREYGVTTGRARRVGYLDLVALRYACRSNGIDRLAMTHLDVYDGIESLRVCVAYETPDRTITTFPAATHLLEQVRPVTETLSGWMQTTAEAKTYDELPSAAREYIAFVERHVGVPVSVVSVGYDRQDTILRSDPWSWSND